MYETENEIGHDGAKAIAEALKTNTTLTDLDLQCKYHTQTLSHSLMTLDLISHHVCVRRSEEAFFFKMCDGLQNKMT